MRWPLFRIPARPLRSGASPWKDRTRLQSGRGTGPEFLALPPEMSGTWRWKIGLWRGLIVEGARAAARFSLGRVLGPPEQGWATKVMDFIRVEHELLAEVVEYVDRRPRRG